MANRGSEGEAQKDTGEDPCKSSTSFSAPPPPRRRGSSIDAPLRGLEQRACHSAGLNIKTTSFKITSNVLTWGLASVLQGGEG